MKLNQTAPILANPLSCEQQDVQDGAGLHCGRREHYIGSERGGRRAQSQARLAQSGQPENGLGRNAQALEGPTSSGAGLLYAKKLTVPQAAKVMGIGQTKLREIVYQGEIPVIRIKSKILILDRDLEAFLMGHFGTLNATPTKPISSLPPLPKHIAESDLLKKTSRHAP